MAKGEENALQAAIEHVPLSRVIYNWLRKAILSGNLEPGTVLRQEDLARRFNSSRVPLREALNHLEAEGFVTLRPRRGYVVTPLGPEQLLEWLQLRMVVEEHAAYIAAQRRTAQDIRRLESCLRDLDKLPVSGPKPHQVKGWMLLNQAFHDTLESASGRPHLNQVSSNLRDKVAPYIRLELTITQQIEEAQADHHAIFDAFRQGDAPHVARLCRLHCERTAVRFIGSLQAKGHALNLSPSMIVDTGPSTLNGQEKPAAKSKTRRAAQ